MELIKRIFKKRSIKDLAWVYTGSLSNGVSLFLINIILGRSLSQEQYGIFSLAILVLSTVAELSDFGLNAGLLRFAPYYIAQNQIDKLKQLLKTIWRWRIALSLILTIGGVLTSPLVARYIFGEPEVTLHVAYAYLGVGGVILLGFIATYLQASQRFQYHSILQFLKGSLRLLGVVILWALGDKNIFNYLSVYIFVPWVLFFVSYTSLPKQFSKVSIDEGAKKDINKQLAGFSVWLVLWSLMSIVAARVDQAMISSYLGLKQVAIYGVAYQFLQFYPMLTQSIASVLTPRINGLKRKEEVADFIKYALRWLVPLTIVVALLIYPSKWFIVLFFGPSYAEAMPVYLVLSYSIVLNIIATPISLAITVFNQTKLVALSGVVQLLLNIVANITLIPRFGVMGAAFAFGLGILVSVMYNAGCALYLMRKKELTIR